MLIFGNSQYFNALLESFSSGVLVFNTADRVYGLNNAACEILGMDREEIMASGFRQIFSGLKLIDELAEIFSEAAKGEISRFPLNTTYRRRDGNSMYLSMSISEVVDYGKVFGIMVEINNVTDIFRLHEREKDLLNDMHRAEKEKAEGLAKLASAVAHQVRNPLMIIGGFTSILKKKIEDDSPLGGYVDGIMDGARRLEQMVGAIEEYNRLSDLNRDIHHAEEILIGLKENLGQRGHLDLSNVEFEYAFEKERLNVDRTLAARALAEVVANSVEAFQGGGGRVVVNGVLEDGYYKWHVLDTGPGVPDENMPYLFDPFFTTKAVGVGMGLCVAKRVATEHGGDVRIDRASAGGVRATICLPAA